MLLQHEQEEARLCMLGLQLRRNIATERRGLMGIGHGDRFLFGRKEEEANPALALGKREEGDEKNLLVGQLHPNVAWPYSSWRR